MENTFDYYRDLYYLTLPQEVNIRVSAVYYKLYKSNADSNLLIDELKKTTEWLILQNIKDFKYQEYSTALISNFGLYFTIKLINEFNTIMNIKTKIYSEKDVYNYFKKYKKYSVSVYNNYKNKLLKIVDKLSTEDTVIKENVILENYIGVEKDIYFNDFINIK